MRASDLHAAIRALPRAPGAYVFRDRRAAPLYVGRARDLRRRVGSYFRLAGASQAAGALADRPHLRAMVRRARGLETTRCDTEHAAAFLERDLIARLDPPFNRSYGTEVEVYIRLRPDGALHVVHDTLERGSRHFGPYLGGRAVRDAAIALRMLYPLDRESLFVARARGVVIDDARARLIALLEGDDRELAAALARLAVMRDAASERLAFEFAADVETRIASLGWISEAPCVLERTRTSAKDGPRTLHVARDLVG